MFSFFFPNYWAFIVQNEVQIRFRAVLINNKPVLFNKKLLDGPLAENESETIELVHRPLSLSKKNTLLFFDGQNLMKQKISDCSDIIVQVESAL